MKANLISIIAIAIVFAIKIQQPLNAFKPMQVTMPLDVLIQNSDNPQATILNMKDTITPGHKLIAQNQLFAFMFNPDNPNEPVVIVDIKKALLKFVLQHPEISQYSEITTKDFETAGFSVEELRALSREPITLAEQGLLATIMGDFVQGDYLIGGKYCLNGCWEIVKGTAKISIGLSILLKKALVGIYNFARKVCTETAQIYQEA